MGVPPFIARLPSSCLWLALMVATACGVATPDDVSTQANRADEWHLDETLVAGGAECLALSYQGNGGQRIQAAVNDSRCRTILVAPAGPDVGGLWLVTSPIDIPSNKIVRSPVDTQLPVLVARGTSMQYKPMIQIVNRTNVTLRRLNLQGQKLAGDGIVISGSSYVTVTMSVVARFTEFGVYLTDKSNNTVAINWNTIDDIGTDNGATSYWGIGIRTDGEFHSTVSIDHNIITAAYYGVALSNCGGSTVTRCFVRMNTIKPRRPYDTSGGSGIDLNQADYAEVGSNNVYGNNDACSTTPGLVCDCGMGITVDDNMGSSIHDNVVDGCVGAGIAIANGAVPANKPWVDTGNIIERNTVRNNGWYGMYASCFEDCNSSDLNEYNVFRFNTLTNNSAGACNQGTTGPDASNTWYENGGDCDP